MYGKILPVMDGVKTIFTLLGDLAKFLWLFLRWSVVTLRMRNGSR